jgi:hypothetical protein
VVAICPSTVYLRRKLWIRATSIVGGMTKRTVPDAAYLTNPKGDDHEGKSISVALKKAVPTLRRLWRCARLELLDCCWHPFE